MILFRIDGTDLYMDRVLIDYNEIPVFYVCTGKEYYYLVLCTDMKEQIYYITRASVLVLSSMICGEISMRDGFMRGTDFWKVQTGDSIDEDVIINIKPEEIHVDDLPKEECCFKAYSSELVSYRNKLLQIASNEKIQCNVT